MEEDNLVANKTPYFHSILSSLEKKKTPIFGEVNSWLIIFGSEVQQFHAMNYVNAHKAFKTFHIDFADYHPTKFEHIGDQLAAQATRNVILKFVQNVGVRDLVKVRTDFFPRESLVYTKPHSYNELEFRVYNTEVQMEFYLWMVRKFCLPSGAIFSVFGGRKLTCAAMMSSVDVFVVGGSGNLIAGSRSRRMHSLSIEMTSSSRGTR